MLAWHCVRCWAQAAVYVCNCCCTVRHLQRLRWTVLIRRARRWDVHQCVQHALTGCGVFVAWQQCVVCVCAELPTDPSTAPPEWSSTHGRFVAVCLAPKPLVSVLFVNWCLLSAPCLCLGAIVYVCIISAVRDVLFCACRALFSS